MRGSEEGLSRAAVPLAPSTVLRRLAESGTSGDLPEVSVHLVGGQVLNGLPVRVGDDRGQEVVVLAGAAGAHLGYAVLADVVAVVVRDPERVQDLLTDGRLPQPAAGEPVTRLALRREFAPSEDFHVDVDWSALPDSEPALSSLARLLHALREIAASVCADEMGRGAWTRIGTLRVAHRDGARLSVERVGDGMSVYADLTAALPRDLTGELDRQINAML